MIKLEVVADNAGDLIGQLQKLIRGNVHIELPAVTVSSTQVSTDGAVDIDLHKAPAPTPLEAAIETAGRSDVARIQETVAKVADEVITPAATRPRGRPRNSTKQAPAGAPEGIEPSVPASQPAVDNTGNGSLPPSPSVGDAVTPPAAEAKAPVAAADAAACRKALQDLNTRIGGNEGLDAVSDVISKFGFSKVSQITPDTHDAIIAAAAAYQKPV